MKELRSKERIQARVESLATLLNTQHEQKQQDTPPVFIGLLNGCFMFYTDLVRNLNFPIECDFMRVKSYLGKNKQGDVQITKDLEIPIKGKDIYIIDDILDSGNTLNIVTDYLKVKNPKTISAITYLKRHDSLIPTQLDSYYKCDEIGDEWIVGYGCDDENGNYRNSQTIYEV